MNTKMDFYIELGKPENNLSSDNEDSKLSEAIYTIFPLDAEDAVLHWGDETILLSYRYDIATIIDDIIQMIFTLKNNTAGKWHVDWPSNTFAGAWDFSWSGMFLEIKTKWREEFGASDYLTKNNVIKIEKDKFLDEWKKIINIVLINLSECGYSDKNLTDMGILIKLKRILDK